MRLQPLKSSLALTTAIALSLAPLAAQDSLPGVFGDVIDVRVVNLEVVVIDEDGNRVPDLPVEDFRLEIDGEQYPIEFFNEVRAGIAIDKEDSGSSVPGVAPGHPVGTSYLVFVDSFFTLPRDRDTVIDALAEDLGLLAPEDRVAVVSWNGRTPEMISSWSQSQTEIQAALGQAKELQAMGLQRLAEKKRFDFDGFLLESQRFREGGFELNAESIGVGGGSNRGVFGLSGFLSDMTPEERFYASLLAGHVERSVRAAASTLRSFATPPGRKVMVLLMGGWPFLPGQFAVADSNRLVYDWGRSGSPGDLFRDLTDTANRLGYTIYPVDVEGLSQSLPDASQRSSFVAARGQRSSFLREREVHSSLAFIASETGGEAYFNSQRRLALERIFADTRSYYWLGFSPTWKGDDTVRDVRVTVSRPGLSVRMRKDYLDLSRKAETTMAVEGALMFGVPLPGARLDLDFGVPERAGRGKVHVPLEVSIPMSRVAFLPTGQGDELAANLELRIAVIDQGGNQADIPVIPIELKGRGTPTEEDKFIYETSLEMRRQRHEVVVAVYDPTSGTMISGSAEITP